MRVKSLALLVTAVILTGAIVIAYATDRGGQILSNNTPEPGMRSLPPQGVAPHERPQVDQPATLRSAQRALAAADDCGPYFTWQGPRDSTAYGLVINTVGDIDHDTFDDVWIAEFAWEASSGGYIYSGFDQSLLCTIEPDGPGGYIRNAASADFNGDGYNDLIFTDPLYDGVAVDAGRLYIVYGSATGFPSLVEAASADVTIDGVSDSVAMGIGLVVLQDIDGDTHPDFAVSSAETQIDGPGHVYVYSGYTQDLIYTLTGTGTGTRFGWDLVNPGDVNDDGYDDLLIGAAFGAGPGYALVVSATDGTVLYHLTGETNLDRFSWYGLNGAGDLNQDGYADVIVGAYGNDAGGGNAGRAYVFFGGDPGPSPDTINAADADFIVTGTPSSFLGFGVGGVGDVNGDGAPDFEAGAIYYGTGVPGLLHIFSGLDGSRMFTLQGLEGYEDFGATCLAPWDLDGDGVKDLLVGAYGQSDYNIGGPARGRVYGYLIGDRDQDGIIAQCDSCQRYATPGNEPFITGDVNQDLSITSADIIYLVGYVFKGQMAPIPIPEVGDVDHNQLVNSTDIIYEVNHVFKGGPAPLDACAW